MPESMEPDKITLTAEKVARICGFSAAQAFLDTLNTFKAPPEKGTDTYETARGIHAGHIAMTTVRTAYLYLRDETEASDEFLQELWDESSWQLLLGACLGRHPDNEDEFHQLLRLAHAMGDDNNSRADWIFNHFRAEVLKSYIKEDEQSSLIVPTRAEQ